METAQQLEVLKPEDFELTGIVVTIRQIQESGEALRTLLSQPIRAVSAYRLKSICKQINRHMQESDNQRVEICQKYGALNPETGNFDIAPENQTVFEQDIENLFETQVHIVAKPLKIYDLGNALISADVLMNLEWLVTDK